MKILIVGGSFDDNGGRPSSLVDKFYYAFGESFAKLGMNADVSRVNGGYFEEVESILQETAYADVVLWWANVPNDKPKIRNVKEVNPKCMLVTSKRNDNEKYSFGELVNRALGAKANLCIEFSKQDSGMFQMMLFDPLGNCWYKGSDISECAENMVSRLQFLRSVTRQSCKQMTGTVNIPNEEEFFDLVKQNAEVFHELINPAPGVTRFLGNSSFRCQRGFPSFRDDKIVYVSKRNVDKRYIGRDAFVPTCLGLQGEVYYRGENKPSVDTPVQLRLYEQLPNIRYMMHAHVYVEGAPFTENMIPCGGLEEVEEVVRTLQNKYGTLNSDFYAVNLVGHGSIVMAGDVEKLKGISYVGRTLPETQQYKNADMEIEYP